MKSVCKGFLVLAYNSLQIGENYYACGWKPGVAHPALQVLVVASFQKFHQIVRFPLKIKILALLFHVLLPCKGSSGLIDLYILVICCANQ